MRKDAGTSKSRSTEYLNMLPNAFWSVLCITPVFLFSYWYLRMPWVYGFGALSLTAYTIPALTLRRLQLSSKTGIYRRLRVHLLVRVTQDSRWIKAVSNGHSSEARWLCDRGLLKKVVRTTYGRERFHLAMLCYFLLATIYAAGVGRPGWCLLLCVSNLIYNLYPIWLQQYIRIRLQRCLLRWERAPQGPG